MDNYPFWVADMDTKGSQRIDQEELALNPLQKRAIGLSLNKAPGWCEINYINTQGQSGFGVREYLLVWVFSMIKGQYVHAVHTANLGAAQFCEEIFDGLYKCAENKFLLDYLKLTGKSLREFTRKVLNKR